MITTATNNLSPAIHSQGFFSRTIHSQHRYLRQKLSHTAYIAQFTHQPQPFYAKQTQFPKKSNPPNHQHSKDLRQNGHLVTREKQTQFQFQAGGSICPRLRRWYCLLPRFEFCAWCFEFVSDLDIRISCFNPTIMQNKPNSQNAGLNLTSYEHMDYEQNPPLPVPPKQTQSNPILNPPPAHQYQ